jgi:hypothetical protein
MAVVPEPVLGVSRRQASDSVRRSRVLRQKQESVMPTSVAYEESQLKASRVED